MRLKLLLLFIAQILCVTVFGQSTDKAIASAEKKDSVQIQKTSGIAPAFASAEITPALRREDAPVRADKMDSRKSIFYSNAQIYVAPNASDASMFIQGTAKFDDKAEILQVGETDLTGDFVSLKGTTGIPPAGTVKPLFVKAEVNTGNTIGTIKFVGKKNSQYIVRENLAGIRIVNTLDHVVGATSETANANKVGENSEYVMEFPILKVVKDQFTKVSDINTEKTATGYNVEQKGFVSVNSNVAMSVENLDMTNGDRFSIDVVSHGLENNTTASPDLYRLNSAYVDIRKITDAANLGQSEVNMRMYNYTPGSNLADADAQVSGTNTTPVILAGGAASKATFLRGFSSPFDKLRADYMFYHVLTEPSATSITSWNGPVSDPRTNIVAGKGYFMGMDVSREYFSNIETKWGHGTNGSDRRARGGYNLSRVVQRMKDEGNANKRFSLYTFDAADASADADPVLTRRVNETQRFNVDQVKVKVQGSDGAAGYGLNFLGNPFMTPIDMSGLLARYDDTQNKYITGIEADQAALETVYTPRFNADADKVRAVHYLTTPAITNAKANGWLLLRSKYWVVSSALVANTTIGGVAAYAYNVKYDNAVAVSQATTVPNVLQRHLEPMQMFLVQAATTGDFVFTQKMKTFKGKSFATQFHNPIATVPKTRGVAADANETEDSFLPSDWLVVEAIAGTGNSTAVDRTAVRFFDQATLGVDKLHDDVKRFSEPDQASSEARMLKSADNNVERGSSSNFVYTTATSGEKLLSNGVGYDTKEIPLYYISDGTVQNVTFAITGIEGFDRVSGVSLVDRFVNGDGTELVKPLSSTDNIYEFTTMPGLETVDGENRFALRFGENEKESGITITNDPITCYYSGSTLYIGGLNEKDLGSKVQIFDLQGRLMGSTIVNNYPAMEYSKPLGQGTFIVNISGERNYKTKFVNLQNY